MSFLRPRLLRLLAALFLLAAVCGHGAQASSEGEGDITLQSEYWIDESGRATIAEVSHGAAQLQPMARHRAFQLGTGALWMRFELPRLDPGHRWYLLLPGSPFIDSATLFTSELGGGWHEQHAGDHLPVAQWEHPNIAPLFSVRAAEPGPVWLRIANQPAPTSPFVQLLTDDGLQFKRQWTYLLVGGYLGFGMLVFLVGLMHARLYGDRVFDLYCIYVACMLLFQLAFTGVGGVFLWRDWASINDAAPALFMLPMVASGIWFVRVAAALQRHNRWVDRFARLFSVAGLALGVAYLLVRGPFTYALLNFYGLSAVAVSIGLCFWSWRKGERYSGWVLLGFLPVHLGYPFPALRAAGVLPDSWATQYAVLIGSAIEIPMLLWILHWRAKDFSESRVRTRALDSTDPLTGLAIAPVLRLRLRDALRRAQRTGQRCSVLMVELSNHAEIVAREGHEAGDRALVVAAARLSAVVRDVDTVCRTANTRFTVLTEGSQSEDRRRLLAQHIVARGLEEVPQLPRDLTLRFRVVTASAPDGAIQLSEDATFDEQQLMQRLNRTLDRMLERSKRVVHHMDPHAADTGHMPVTMV